MMAESTGDISLGLEAIKGFAGKITQALLGFVGTIIFARALGPTSFGGYYFLLSLVFIADRPLRGMAKAVEKRYSEEGSAKSEILGTVFLGVAALTGVALVALLLGGEFLRAETNVESASVVFLVLFLSMGLFTNLGNILGAAGLPARQIWNDTLRSVLTLALQLFFVFAGFGAAGMGYGLAAATFLTVPVALYFIRQRPRMPSSETLRSLWDYARYSIPGSFVSVAYNRLDVLLLGFFLTTGAVGQYEVALKLTIPATLLASAVDVAFMPKISNLASREEEIVNDIENALAFNSILAIPLLFGAAALSTKLVVTIYGSEYRSAATLLIGLAVYQVIFTQKTIFTSTLGGIDRPDLSLRIHTGAFLFNVVIGVALLFSIGAFGVVLATIAAELLAYIMTVVVVRKFVPKLNPFPRTLVEQTGAGLLMFVVIKGATQFIAIQGWIELLFIVGFGAAVYGTVLLLISSSLRLTIRSVFREALA